MVPVTLPDKLTGMADVQVKLESGKLKGGVLKLELQQKLLVMSVHSISHYHVSCCCIGLLACAQQNGIYTPSCDR
jgi:hypothetical protein